MVLAKHPLRVQAKSAWVLTIINRLTEFALHAKTHPMKIASSNLMHAAMAYVSFVCITY